MKSHMMMAASLKTLTCREAKQVDGRTGISAIMGGVFSVHDSYCTGGIARDIVCLTLTLVMVDPRWLCTPTSCKLGSFLISSRNHYKSQ